MNTEFKRESIVRHQSERLLDTNLISFERKKAPLQDYEKAIQKKIKKDEEEKKNREEVAAKMKDTKPQDALEMVMKHFENSKKNSKAIVIYKDLLAKNIDSLEPDHVFYSLYQLMKNFHLMQTAEDKKTINAIFQLIEAKKDKVLRTSDYKNVYEIWKYEGFVHPQIFTDDSYQFNSAIKKIKELVADLSKPEEELIIHQETPVAPVITKPEAPPVKADLGLIRSKLTKKKEEPVPVAEPVKAAEPVEPALPKYEYNLPQECLDEIKNQEARREWRRSILFEVTRDIYGMFKHTWAKPTVKQYFDHVYLEREIFNEEQKKGIEDFKAGLSSLKGFDTVKGFRRDTLDSKILSNPLVSSNEVKDGRSTAFAFDGLGKWAGRQSGL